MIITKISRFTSTMKTTTTSKKFVSEKILSAAVVITMMASVILAVWQIPTATATP